MHVNGLSGHVTDKDIPPWLVEVKHRLFFCFLTQSQHFNLSINIVTIHASEG